MKLPKRERREARRRDAERRQSLYDRTSSFDKLAIVHERRGGSLRERGRILGAVPVAA